MKQLEWIRTYDFKHKLMASVMADNRSASFFIMYFEIISLL